jgi:hypothetical protein
MSDLFEKIKNFFNFNAIYENFIWFIGHLITYLFLIFLFVFALYIVSKGFLD